ncbi:ribonuclease H-like domain-containing protein [Blautia sp. MSJ-19]|uniref:ribonuclease H-like domain-containing protein n=1 Tax=Blautia sp. MSJ-19 TaxID=2841517 RepID=UPI001C0ED0A0|nr:ribonuclease H-like domain-containing protein [Blautia sp. MSJ-19]MBU5481926.1 ribonuclease H-like domain-containing protein [Blautia sp. MSJ-19]
MIVKKIPILQGFPALETVKYLSKAKNELSDYNPIFYDIETTGLSRYTAFVYLIGAVRFEQNAWYLYQWMCADEDEEALILQEFYNFLIGADCTIQYNGNRFDQPFLEERYRKHKMESPFWKILSLDLYQLLKPCQSLFKLTRMKQPDLESFAGIHKRKFCDGGQCIRLYKSFMKKNDADTAEIVMGHNEEDLLGLGRIFTLLSYKKLYDGEYRPVQGILLEQELKLVLELPTDVPVSVSCGNAEFYLTVSGREAKMLVHLKEGKLRQYYKNYKDYDYIPGEDMAMPKSLTRYMDKSLRIAATPQTCYTWFNCDEDFLNNEKKQMQYLTHTLSFYLNNFNK